MGWIFLVVGLLQSPGWAADYSFTNAMAEASAAMSRGDAPAVLRIYEAAQRAESNHVANLCALARRYCDLTYFTNATSIGMAPPELLRRALVCAQLAIRNDPSNALAHACAAVAYAKSCTYADIKTELAFSRLLKEEAERAVALDPRQDIGYYLLGRWNYAIANLGLFSRTFAKVVYGGLPPASNAAAIAYFKKAIELSPDRILHHAGLAMVYASIGQKQLELAELRTCSALKPHGPEDRDAQRDALKRLATLNR